MGQLKGIKLNTPSYREIIPSTKKEVKITPFKVGDEKILLMAAESKDSKQILDSLKKVVSGCTTGEEIENLASFDIEYLFLKIRSISVGETAKIMLACSECETANDVTIDLPKVAVEGIDNFKTMLKITDDLAFEMKLPEIDSYIDIEDTPESIIKFIAKNVNKVFYGEDVFELNSEDIQDVVEIIEQLTSQQFEMLQDYVISIPKVAQETSFTCSHCGKENNNKLQGLTDFF